MGTMGLVTVRDTEKVLMKIVVGTDGMRVKQMAKMIRTFIRKNGRHPIIREAVDMAKAVHFGSENDRIVITADSHYSECGQPGQLYRDTFDQPKFNPRWDIGITEFYQEVNIDRVLRKHKSPPPS